MSDLETRPREQVCRSTAGRGEQLLITARRVPLGKTTEVARALPDRQIRMIGAWCFLDHYGPEELGGSPGMQVWAHPHTGLQTVSWLLEGEVEHRDSLGSQAMVRPDELNIMTAGRGIVHSEISLPDRPPRLHGVQLWVALPDGVRDIEPRFESYAELPDLVLGTNASAGIRGKLLLGELAGRRSPAITHSRLCGADLTLEPGSIGTLEVDPTYEYGAFVVAGSVTVEDTAVAVDQLVYLGTGRSEIRLRGDQGGRMIVLGGEPFGEDIVMWWNFIGRSHDEIVAYRSAWEQRDVRFPPVVSRDERVMEAPPMPTVALKPRPPRRVGG
ncbi:MAG TPA: pirin family protein [Propionibacteriaceae bacterium]|nr:pirin family protein [Propionibacteriaceae bacterium]